MEPTARAGFYSEPRVLEFKDQLRRTIPPIPDSRSRPHLSSSDQGTGGSQALNKRKTANSIRAGQATVSLPTSRARSTNSPRPTEITERNMPETSAEAGNGRRANYPNRHRMPKPGEKNAPVFDAEKPEELGRFFERVEDWYIDEGVVDDAEKKKYIVKYLDADSEVQWKALSKFATGTYEEFKAQVMSSYPAAEEVMKGSVTALKRKIKKIGPVPTDDRNELLALVRLMTAEIMKLKKITPPIHTNRELVELFLGRLEPEFAARVATKLTVHRLIDSKQPEQQNQARNPEDMYDIEDVMEMAKQTSLEQANPFGKYLVSGAAHATPVNAKLEEAVARLTDSINVQLQHSKSVDQRLHTMQSYMNQPKANQSGPSLQNQNGGKLYYPGGNSNLISRLLECFYCGEEHRITDCAHVNRHLDLGWIKKIEGRLRMSDGNKLPREPGKTTKESVESQRGALKPGLIPMARLPEGANLYQRMPNSTYVQESRDEEDASSINEFIQRLGIEKVRQCLTIQSEIQKEEDDWEQNFY